MPIPGYAALAPLAGVSDSSFRQVCKLLGAGLVFSEMVSSEGLVRDDEKSYQYLKFVESERPIGIQLFGADPDIMADAAARVAKISPDFIDLNFGCPVKKVVKRGAGAAVLKDLNRMQHITERVVKASVIPVTVKIRSGWSTDQEIATDAAQIVQDAGAAAIIMHPRFQTQQFKGRAEWSLIAIVKQAVTIPVIGNGDIKSVSNAKAMYDSTGCDYIMIGRGAMGNPWLFQHINAEISGAEPISVTAQERYRVMKLHLAFIVEEKGERLAVQEMRKHLAWYIKGWPNSASLRAQLMQTKRLDDIQQALEEFFKSLEHVKNNK
ncbi:tRNA dihydrouridine synthase DusB [candidate division KSB1 bacterium]|nr:tRNA dihydrouridine synthase DusB [candidate division KSB1 bacterium]